MERSKKLTQIESTFNDNLLKKVDDFSNIGSRVRIVGLDLCKVSKAEGLFTDLNRMVVNSTLVLSNAASLIKLDPGWPTNHFFFGFVGVFDENVWSLALPSMACHLVIAKVPVEFGHFQALGARSTIRLLARIAASASEAPFGLGRTHLRSEDTFEEVGNQWGCRGLRRLRNRCWPIWI